MGRRDGKLIPFLKNGLQNKSYMNLKWQDKASERFTLKLPRYGKSKDLKHYEKILKEWCYVNSRKYSEYSDEKAVIQAALKKSVYLVTLKSNGSELLFKFATKAEELEKRRKQKEAKRKEKLTLCDSLPEFYHLQPLSTEPVILQNESDILSYPSPSLSPLSNSSGYQSWNEDFEENELKSNIFENSAETIYQDSVCWEDLEDLFKNPENYIKDDVLDIVMNDDISDDVVVNNVDTSPLTVIKGMEVAEPINCLEKPVTELTPVQVVNSKIPDTYWICTRKVHVDSTLLLICEKQIIQDNNQGFVPGQIYLNNIFEPGEAYTLQQMLEIDGKCYLFLLRNN